MQTRLSLLCDKIIETGWLMAAIVTPLFFNWYSNRVFESSKVGLLGAVTVVMLAAWLIKVLETRLPREKRIGRISLALLRAPLIAPVLFFAGAYVLSTVTSVVPQTSFWGSYQRRQGLYVVLCYIAIFFLMLETLRTRKQLERVITAILLTSLPVALYGIMQHQSLDPLVWVTGGDTRVQSTLGNPILMGAYLIMVVPLTVWQLIRSFAVIRAKGVKAGPSMILFGCYLVLLILQLVCLMFTQSRGPEISLVAGVSFFFLLLAVLRGRRGLALAAVGVSVALLAILIVVNLPHPLLTLPEGLPYIQRLTEISRDIMGDRSLIWHGVVNMITADRTRAVIGYGPETMGLIFYPYMHPDWADLFHYTRTADRSHNETLDSLVTGGLIGFAAYLTLFGSIFYHGFKQLGLITTSRQRTFFVGACLAGGFSGVLISWLVEGTLKWAGVGIPAGILLALVIYLMTTLFRRGDREVRWNHDQILLIILLSTIIAHFIEIQSGIAITATRTYFWFYAALLVIVGRYWQRGAEPVEGEEPISETPAESLLPDSSSQRRDRWQRRRSKLQASNSSTSLRTGFKLPDSEFLAHSLLVGMILATTSFDLITHQFDLRTNGPVFFGLLCVTWLFGGILTLTHNSKSSISNLSTYMLGSLFCFLPFLVAHAAIVMPGAGVERATSIYYVYFLLVIFAVAVALMIGRGSSRPLYSFRAWWLYPIIGIGGFLLILNTNLKVAQADVYYKFALSAEETREIDKAIAIYRRAIELSPHCSNYYSSLGWAYSVKATTVSDTEQRADLFEEGIKWLEHAQQMVPYAPDLIAALGNAYANWGSLTPDPEQRAEKFEAALTNYRQAVTLSPLNHDYLLKNNMVLTYLGLGVTYADLGKLSQAAEAYQRASEKAPDNYEAHRGLVVVYLQWGHLDEALEEARIARALAPGEDRPTLDDLIAQLEARKSQ